MARSDRDGVASTSHFVHVDSRYTPERRLVRLAKTKTRAWLHSHPDAFWSFVPLYRAAQRTYHRSLRFACHVPRDRFLDPDRLLSVPPSAIEFKTLLPGSALRGHGCGWVLDGDWDAPEHPFVNDRRYKAVRDVLADGKRWQDTQEYAEAVQTLDAGRPVRYCCTRQELDARYRDLDGLARAISDEGYLTQQELRARRTREWQLGRQDEISVAIGRHGEILYRDGAHRLAIAKLVGVPCLPVEVEVRHADWMTFRRAIEGYAVSHGGKVPTPLLHPDLDNVPSHYTCTARLSVVEEHLSTPCAVLDLAPGWGYFATRLEERGATCTVLTGPSSEGPFLAGLRRACGRTFAMVSEQDLRSLPEERRRFDACLLLNDGLGHAPTFLTDVERVLRGLAIKDLLVEPDAFTRRAGRPADPASDERRFLESLMALTGLSDCTCVGRSSEAGPLYRLS